MHSPKSLSFSAVGLAVLMTQLITPVSAGDWFVIGHQSAFCGSEIDGNTWYGWRGDDDKCHNFGDESSGCIFNTNVDGTYKAVSCSPTMDNGQRAPKYINSVGYNLGVDNDGRGCQFYYGRDCTDDSISLNNFDLVNFCYDFSDDDSIVSFQCL